MKPSMSLTSYLFVSLILLLSSASVFADSKQIIGDYTVEAGHPSLANWLLPEQPPYPEGNEPTTERVALGKMLFFDPRLSRDGNMSCATCHNPAFGWSDGQATALGVKSKVLGRATPTITNTAYNSLQMWDGRKRSLEDQAMGPLEADVEMNMNFGSLLTWLQNNGAYKAVFALAYPNEGINKTTLSKAIASFERTIVSNNSPFDRWVKGDETALTKQQVRGFKVFLDEEKGNCAACHQAPNFTDNGFHNLGLASYDQENPDMGRYTHKPIGLMKGAFKTPTLRDVTNTGPYFHDGSAETLMDVVEHYVTGGVAKENISPSMKALKLTQREKHDLVEFMHALTSPPQTMVLPSLPSGTVTHIRSLEKDKVSYIDSLEKNSDDTNNFAILDIKKLK